MAGYYEATDRSMRYAFTATPSNAEGHTPALSLVVQAVDADLFAELDRAVSNDRLSTPDADGNLPQAVREALRMGAFTAPIYFGDRTQEAVSQFCALVGVNDVPFLLQSLLMSREIVIPVFGSAPEEWVTLGEILADTATRASIVVGESAAGIVPDGSGPATLVLFYLGGVVAVKIVNPVFETLGLVLVDRIRKAFKLDPPP